MNEVNNPSNHKIIRITAIVVSIFLYKLVNNKILLGNNPICYDVQQYILLLLKKTKRKDLGVSLQDNLEKWLLGL